MGLAAAAAVAAAILVTLPSHKVSPRRAAVIAYIKHVDRTQGRLTYSMTRLSLALKRFASSKTYTPAELRQLDRAAPTLQRLRSQLAAVPAPSDAQALRTKMLALVASEAELTHEVAVMARFTPAFASALRPLHAASKALALALAAAKPPTPHVIRGTKKQIAAAQAAFTAASDRTAAAEAAAVAAYDTVVATTMRCLRPLVPPPAFRPAYRAQLVALRASNEAGRRLSAGLLQPQSKRINIAALGRRFTVTSRRSQTISAQLTEIAAIKAYNARVSRVQALQLGVQKELARLSAKVK